KVQVVNGTGTPGLAAGVSQTLKGRGFTVSGTSTAASPTTLTTVTYPAGMEGQAKALAAAVPGAAVAAAPGISSVTLTLGTDEGRAPLAGRGGGGRGHRPAGAAAGLHRAAHPVPAAGRGAGHAGGPGGGQPVPHRPPVPGAADAGAGRARRRLAVQRLVGGPA